MPPDTNASTSGKAAVAGDEPQPKRAKPSAAGALPVFRESLFTAESRAALRAAFDASQPYTHLVLQDLCDVGLLRQVREEVIHNINATYKETDLFKVFQTGDLANLDALDPESAAKLPGLQRLRDALYSDHFKRFVRDITGCGELSSTNDLSCNVYARGGHLLCHDDVIGSRRVSYIIYLTDPDEPWAVEDGGTLELFPVESETSHVPAVVPTISLLPTWNSMAMFTVQPGRSFHAVQEVHSAEKPRLSISGWFHAPAAPDGAAHASLAQLQLRPGEDAVAHHTPFEGGLDAMAADLSDADRQLLGSWVAAEYLDPVAWDKIRARFAEDGSVQLQGFLKKEVAKVVVAAAREQDEEAALGHWRMPAPTAGYGAGWEAVGPPHKQRYLRYRGAAADLDGGGAGAATAAGAGCGALLAALQRDLFQSSAFGRLLKAFTTITMLGHAGEVRRLRPGLDYTVAHYGVITKDPRLDCVLTFVEDQAPQDAEAWESGEVGGFEAYLLADEEEGGAAAVYRARDDDGGVINVPPAANSLHLLLRDAGLMRFVKYVGAGAPSSRWDVAMEYLPEDDGSSEEEEGGGQ